MQTGDSLWVGSHRTHSSCQTREQTCQAHADPLFPLQATLPFYDLAPLETKRRASYKYDCYVSGQARTQATQVPRENARLAYLWLWLRALLVFGGVW